MRIQVIERGNTESKKSAKGTTYSLFNLKYESDGKPRDRKIMSFDKDAYGILKNATPNEQYEIDLEKNGDFWDWKKVVKVDAANDASASGTGVGKPVAKGNWETSEERAKRQVYIARQNSVTNAVNFCGSDSTVDEVLSVAKQFVDFIFSGMESTDDEPNVD
jgi:hypothetical protein